MTAKVKTAIECYFLLPDFFFRGHPSLSPWGPHDGVKFEYPNLLFRNDNFKSFATQMTAT